MLQTLILVLELIGAVLVLFPAGARAIEAVYQLSQTPNLNTIGKIWQVVKNFFSIEKYQAK
jgi:hypothetical protein